MHRIIIFILCFISLASMALPVYAEQDESAFFDEPINTGADGNKDLVKQYTPLSDPQDIPGLQEAINQSDSLSGYLTLAYTLLITIGIVLAVILTVYHGFQYAITDIFQTKRNAREALTSIAIGLGLILGAYLILFTINPAIVNFSFNGGVSTVPTNSNTQFRVCKDIASGYQLGEPKKEGVYIKYFFKCYDNEYAKDVRVQPMYSLVPEKSYEQMLSDGLAAINNNRLPGDPVMSETEYLNAMTDGQIASLKDAACEAKALALRTDPKQLKGLTDAQCVYIQERWAARFLIECDACTMWGSFFVRGTYYWRTTKPLCEFDKQKDAQDIPEGPTQNAHSPYQSLKNLALTAIYEQKGVAWNTVTPADRQKALDAVVIREIGGCEVPVNATLNFTVTTN